MFCRKCGKEIPDDSAFCSACGTPAGGQTLTISSHNQRGTHSIIVVSITIIVIIVVSAIIIALMISGSSSKISGKYGYSYNPLEAPSGNHYFWEIDFLNDEECLVIERGYEKLPATYTISGDTIVIKIPSLLSGWSGKIQQDKLILSGVGIGSHGAEFVKFE